MQWIRNLITRVRMEIRYRKKLKELRKRDPLIYKLNSLISWASAQVIMMLLLL
jgi:hypothetical protein